MGRSFFDNADTRQASCLEDGRHVSFNCGVYRWWICWDQSPRLQAVTGALITLFPVRVLNSFCEGIAYFLL